MKIDLGCGKNKKEGFLGVDILKLPGVDIVHGLDSFPYPFSESEVDEISMDQVLEHLKEPLRVLEELYRISKDGAKITIGVPYFRSFYSVIDPTHRNFFGVSWFDYFDPSKPLHVKYQYSYVKFKNNKIEFDRELSYFHKLWKFGRKSGK